MTRTDEIVESIVAKMQLLNPDQQEEVLKYVEVLIEINKLDKLDKEPNRLANMWEQVKDSFLICR